MGGLRERYESKSVRVGRVAAKLGLTPNAITALSVLVAVLAGYFVCRGNLLYGLAIFAIAVSLDMLDGAVARATGKASKFGTLLDRVADRTVEFVIVFSLALGGFLSRPLATFAYFAMILPSYVRILGEKLFGISALGHGLMERKEKLSAIFAGVALEILGLPCPRLGRIDLAAIAVIIGSLITAAQRIRLFARF